MKRTIADQPLEKLCQVNILGFACDEGIRRNQGRVGAKCGPDALRKALSKFPLHDNAKLFQIIDSGNVVCDNENLLAAQSELASNVNRILQSSAFPIVLGGGHEAAWGHYLGLKRVVSDKKFAIVNFDAHFDMRPVMPDGQGNSGTSFLQIAEDRKNENQPFSYYCIGIERAANSDDLFKTAKTWNVKYITNNEMYSDPQKGLSLIQALLPSYDCLYVTLCLDVFSTAVAPGVSAMSPNGLMPYHVIPLLKTLAQSGKVIAFDIVELSPPNDVNGMTAKLGALCLMEFLYSLKGFQHA